MLRSFNTAMLTAIMFHSVANLRAVGRGGGSKYEILTTPRKTIITQRVQCTS